jgi:hypothetical protein
MGSKRHVTAVSPPFFAGTHLESQWPHTNETSAVSGHTNVSAGAHGRQASVVQANYAVKAQVIATHNEELSSVGCHKGAGNMTGEQNEGAVGWRRIHYNGGT